VIERICPTTEINNLLRPFPSPDYSWGDNFSLSQVVKPFPCRANEEVRVYENDDDCGKGK